MREYTVDTIFSNLAAGEYLLVIEDEAGCEVEEVFTIESVGDFMIQDLSTLPASCGEADGQLNLTLTGGGEPYSYTFNEANPTTNPDFDQLMAGNYTLRITDANACERDTSFVIKSGDCELYIPNVFSPNGDGINDWFGLYLKAGAQADRTRTNDL